MYVTGKCVFCDVDMVYKPFESDAYGKVYECPVCGAIAYGDKEDKEIKKNNN